MTTYTHENKFHSRRVLSKYSPVEIDEATAQWHSHRTASPAYAAKLRIDRKLCGIKGCACPNGRG